MRLEIRSRGILLSDELRALTAKRLQFALGRLASEVQRVDVVLEDLNGPRGGVDKACRIRVRGARFDEVFVEERRASVETAVAVASDRACRAVVRALDRERGRQPQARS